MCVLCEAAARIEEQEKYAEVEQILDSALLPVKEIEKHEQAEKEKQEIDEILKELNDVLDEYGLIIEEAEETEEGGYDFIDEILKVVFGDDEEDEYEEDEADALEEEISVLEFEIAELKDAVMEYTNLLAAYKDAVEEKDSAIDELDAKVKKLEEENFRLRVENVTKNLQLNEFTKPKISPNWTWTPFYQPYYTANSFDLPAATTFTVKL